MAKKSTSRTFRVDAIVVMWTNVPIIADSWEEAVEKAKGLGTLDFVTPAGEHNDSKLTLTGIHNDEGLKKLD